MPVQPDTVLAVFVQVTGSSLTWIYECTWTDPGGTSTWQQSTHNRIDLSIAYEGEGYVPPTEVSPPDEVFDVTQPWTGHWDALEDGVFTLGVWPVVYLDDELGACGVVLQQGHLQLDTVTLVIDYEGPIATDRESWGRIKALYR